MVSIPARPPLPDDGTPGWIWTVYSRRPDSLMFSGGHSGTRKRAHEAVEGELSADDDTLFGEVIGPDHSHWICRRGAAGFCWRPVLAQGGDAGVSPL